MSRRAARPTNDAREDSSTRFRTLMALRGSQTSPWPIRHNNSWSGMEAGVPVCRSDTFMWSAPDAGSPREEEASDAWLFKTRQSEAQNSEKRHKEMNLDFPSF